MDVFKMAKDIAINHAKIVYGIDLEGKMTKEELIKKLDEVNELVKRQAELTADTIMLNEALIKNIKAMRMIITDKGGHNEQSRE